jgi:outer membrane protein assembly factor BamA
MRNVMRWVVVGALLWMLAPVVCLHAQETGEQRRIVDRRDRFAESIRPVLVRVEFEGNEGLESDRLKAQIDTRPTALPWVKRFFGTFLTPYELNPFTPEEVRTQVRHIVDSLAGEIRYLNLSTVAQDTVTIRQFYIDHGYHDAVVDFRILLDTARNTSAVRFIINEGPRYPLRGLAYIGLESVPEDVRQQIETPELVKLGEGFSKDDLTAERDRVVEILRNNGYPFTQTGDPTVFQVRKPLPDAPYDTALVPIYPGQRYRFGETERVRSPDDEPPLVNDDVVKRQIEYSPGDWYSRQKVEQTTSNLYALGTFAQVRIDTAANLSHGDTLGMRILTKLRAPRDIKVAYEVGAERVSNDWRMIMGVSPSFNHANLSGNAEHLTLNGYFRTRFPFLQEFQTGAGAAISTPSFSPISNRLSLLAGANYDFAVEDQLQANLNFSDSILLGQDVALRSARVAVSLEGTYRFPKHTFLSYFTTRLSPQWIEYINVNAYITRRALDRIQEEEAQNGSISDQDKLKEIIVNSLKQNLYRVQVLQSTNPLLVSERDSASQAIALRDFNWLKFGTSLAFGFVADKRNDFFYPSKGLFTQLGVDFGLTGNPVNPNGGYVKLNTDARFYFPWGDRKVLAFRGHIGGIMPLGAFPLVPVTTRFTAGGSNSVRGWGPREMLVTSVDVDPGLTTDVPSEVRTVANKILQQIFDESKRLLGGLFIIEASADFRARLFNLPNTGTLNRQLNQLGFIAFVDVGNAYFRDLDDDSELVTVGKILENLGLATGISLTYDTPVGPFTFGYGFQIYDPISQQGGNRWIWNREKPFAAGAFQLGIGYAF